MNEVKQLVEIWKALNRLHNEFLVVRTTLPSPLDQQAQTVANILVDMVNNVVKTLAYKLFYAYTRECLEWKR